MFVLLVALSEVRASCILCITGGQLGLWVGISFITMWELLDLVAQLIAYIFGRGNGKVEEGGSQQHPDTIKHVEPLTPVD